MQMVYWRTEITSQIFPMIFLLESLFISLYFRISTFYFSSSVSSTSAFFPSSSSPPVLCGFFRMAQAPIDWSKVTAIWEILSCLNAPSMLGVADMSLNLKTENEDMKRERWKIEIPFAKL